MKLKSKLLVVDTGAFIKHVPLWELGEELVSVADVLGELKNKEDQQYVAAYPVQVSFKEPSPSSIKFINTFTKKTGDYHVLSVADVKLLALTYELEVAARGSDHLRQEPIKRITNTQVTVPVAATQPDEASQDAESMELGDTSTQDKTDRDNEADGTDNEADGSDNEADGSDNEADSSDNEECDAEDGGWSVFKRSKGNRNAINLMASKDETINHDTLSLTSSARRNREEWVRDMQPGFYLAPDEETIVEDEDPDEGWLTPENIGKPKDDDTEAPRNGYFDEQEPQQQPEVSCITADYAMQNVLLHIGLSVLGVDGKLIRDMRNYVLRCFSCYNITQDMSKIFCARCGNKTLKRVSMTTNADGTQQIWISHKRLNTRGMRYNLPKPRGGQHAVMPLLTSDQRFPHQWAKRSKNLSMLNRDCIAGESPFTTRDVYSRAAQHGYMSGQPRGVNGQLKHAKIWKPKTGKRNKK